MFASFFKQNHQLKLIISGVYAKRLPKCARILKQTAVAQNLIDDFFSNFDCQMTFPEEGF